VREGVGENAASLLCNDGGDTSDAGTRVRHLRHQLAEALLRRVGEVLQQPTRIRQVYDLHTQHDTNAGRKLLA
jgi:hypothetical protein